MAKRWERHSPEWHRYNAQVGDLFHGRLDTSGPRAHALPNRITMLQSGKRGYTGAPSAFEGAHMQVARAINSGDLPTRKPDEPFIYKAPPRALSTKAVLIQ